MWLLFIALFSVGGLFAVDEQVHPAKYPNSSAGQAYYEEHPDLHPPEDSSINLNAPASAAE